MPKVTGPLFSVEAHKQLGKAITFQRRPGGAAVYGYKKPKVPLTAKQVLQRRLVRNAVVCWQALSDANQALWEKRAEGRGQSGYSLFMHENTAVGYNMFLAPDFTVGAGSVLPDLSRFKSHGAITGASWADGLHGKCLDFDAGIPSYVEIPATNTQLNFTSEDFSIIARLNPDNLSGTPVVFMRGLRSGDGYEYWLGSTGGQYFISDQSGISQGQYSTVGHITVGAWSTIGLSRVGVTVKLYHNGIDITDAHTDIADPASCNRSAKIGIYDDLNLYPFDGKIEFFRVFGGVALSAADHLAWHNALK